MRLLIISHTPHYQDRDRIVGWGSTVREIDHLATLFDEVVHIAPIHPISDPGSSLPYEAANVRVRLVQPAGGNRFIDKIGILARIPAYAKTILQEMKGVDIIHVRCPAAISLIALLLLIMKRTPKYRWVKYAGNWQPEHKDHFVYRLQRWLITKNCFRGIGSINGRWPNQQAHLLTFANPCLTNNEIEEGKNFAHKKTLSPPIKLLFVGRLEEAKGVGQVLLIAGELKDRGVEFHLCLIGDGTDRDRYLTLARKLDIEVQTDFVGFLPRDQLGEYYQSAHFILLPSSAEGWPKVLSEAMAYGTVVLASNVGSIPQILNESKAGFAIESKDAKEYGDRIIELVQQPQNWKNLSQRAVNFAFHFSYENYLGVLKESFNNLWNIQLDHE